MINVKVGFFLFIFLFIKVLSYGQKHDNDAYVLQLLDSSMVAQYKNNIKALSYLNEVSRHERQLKATTLVKYYNTAGNIYQSQHSYYLALSFFYKELALQNTLDHSKSYVIYNNIGSVNFEIGNYKNARGFYNKAIQNFRKYGKATNENIKSSLMYSNIAALEEKEGNYVKALNMLSDFQKYNLKAKDTMNIILAYENLAGIHLKLNDAKSATKNLHKGIKLALSAKTNYDLASLYKELGTIYLNHLAIKDSALYYLQNSFDISNKNNFLNFKLTSSEKLVELYEKAHNYNKALDYLHIAKSLSEKNINEEYTKRANQLEFDYKQQIAQQSALLEQKKRENYFIISIVALVSLSSITLLMFKLQKSKSQKRIVENELLARELKGKNKALTSNAMQLYQAKEFIQSTQKDLHQLEISNGQTSGKKLLSKIVKDLKNGTQGFNDKEFEKIFIETDGDFYKKLLKEFPSLSKNEIRLCAFLKMNLSSKEISSITQQSTHSIDVARSRLRKKLDLTNDAQSITSFLMQL